MSYVDQFLNLKCAGDVLNACHPINNPEKEISEAMAVVYRVRKIVLAKPNHYTLIDLCAGNALTSIIGVHLLPLKRAIAIDKNPRRRTGHKMVNKFFYAEFNIFEDEIISFLDEIREDLILTSVHSCSTLAERIIEIYYSVIHAQHLIFMPCCVGHISKQYDGIVEKRLGKYLSWCLTLASKVNGKLYQDNKILSPCNGIIVAQSYLARKE